MKPILATLALLTLAACQEAPQGAISPQEQQARDAEHAQIRQERAYQEYWEWERGDGRK
jgi:hypothetical protein